jgi:spore maturation protein CgeB
MRILVVGPEYPDSFARNVVVAFRRMGFDASTDYPRAQQVTSERGPSPFLSLGARFWPRFENFVQDRFVRRTEALRPDLILVTYGGVTPRTVKRLRETSPAVAAWYTDPSPNLDRDYLLAGDYQCWFFKEPRAVALFRANLGLPVALAGNCYYYRLKMIEGLSTFDLRIWGGSTARWLDHPMLKFHRHHYIAELEKAKAFRAAKIVLNTFTYKETDGMNCRLFEATGCGAFVLTENRPTIPDFFAPGKEVAVFNSREELVERVRHYLSHPEERETIARQGYERAQRDHTYEVRLRKLLEIVGQHTGLLFVEDGASRREQ